MTTLAGFVRIHEYQGGHFDYISREKFWLVRQAILEKFRKPIISKKWVYKVYVTLSAHSRTSCIKLNVNLIATCKLKHASYVTLSNIKYILWL